MSVEIIPIRGLGEIAAGQDLAGNLVGALQEIGCRDGDVLVVTHKVVSKAEGRVVDAPDDAAYRRIVEEEAAAVLRRRAGLAITRNRNGFISANAGVDRSNVPPGRAVLLPVDPDRSAHRIQARLEHATGRRIAVVITDTFGRAWRRGLCDVAIGVAGMPAIRDLRGTTDTHGRVLDVTEVAVVDEIAAAADLVMGKNTGIPAAIVRGVDWLEWDQPPGRAGDLVRPAAEDLFR